MKIFSVIFLAMCSVLVNGQDLFGPTEIWTGRFVGDYGNRFADVNGDGKDDAIAVHDKIYVRLSNGNTFLAQQAWTNEVFTGTHGQFHRTPRNFFTDVTGDGKADAIAVRDDKVYVRRSTGSTFGPSEAWTTGPFNAQSPAGIDPNWYYDIALNFFADVNGDGLSDGIIVHYNRIGVILSTGNSFGAQIQWKDVYLANNFQDMNGDGTADAYMAQEGAKKTYIAFSTGNSFGQDNLWLNSFWPADGLADVTGDGKADAINSHSYNGNIVKISTGTGFLPSVTGTSNVFVTSYFSDLTGDGKADAIKITEDQILVRRSNFKFSDCSTDLIIDHLSYLRSNAIAKSIQTQGQIALKPNQSYSITAGQTIRFKPGFVAPRGSVLVATTTDCQSGGGSRLSTTDTGTKYEDLKVFDESLLVKNDELASDRLHSSEGLTVYNYPNPADDFTVIHLASECQSTTLLVRDSFGKVICETQGNFLVDGKQAWKLETGNWPRGLYYYSIKCNNNSITKKLILR